MGKCAWQTPKFITFAKVILWDLQNMGALAYGIDTEKAEEIITKRGYNLVKDGLESIAGFPPHVLPPYANLPTYSDEIDKLEIDEISMREVITEDGREWWK